jgi:hypothetical protein
MLLLLVFHFFSLFLFILRLSHTLQLFSSFSISFSVITTKNFSCIQSDKDLGLAQIFEE